MNEALDSYLSWWQFFLIAGVLWLLYYLLKRFKNYVYHATSLHTLHLPNIIILVLFILSFLLVNPVIHGFILAVCGLLLYPVLSSFLRGIIAFNNTKLKKGDLIKIGKQEGRIDDISLSGVKLITGSNNIFIPFGKLASEVIERYHNDQTLYLSLLCTPENESKFSISEMERLLFNFPFLEHKSNIEIIQLNNQLKVNLSLANNRFRTSLLKQISNAGYQVELAKNN